MTASSFGVVRYLKGISLIVATENARPDDDRPPKTGDLTMHDLTLTG